MLLQKPMKQLSMQEGADPQTVDACIDIDLATDAATKCAAAKKNGDVNGAACTYTPKKGSKHLLQRWTGSSTN